MRKPAQERRLSRRELAAEPFERDAQRRLLAVELGDDRPSGGVDVKRDRRPGIVLEDCMQGIFAAANGDRSRRVMVSQCTKQRGTLAEPILMIE